MYSGGEYGSSRPPSVTVSGIAYTISKTALSQVVEGTYNVKRMVKLGPNEYSINDISFKQQSVGISKDEISEVNGFMTIPLLFKEIKKLSAYTIINCTDNEMVLYGKYVSGKGKTFYYNVFLVYQHP
jgi:hypothetical protein